MRDVRTRPENPGAAATDREARADQREESYFTAFVLGVAVGVAIGLLILGLKVVEAEDYIHELEERCGIADQWHWMHNDRYGGYSDDYEFETHLH